jgi:transcriptional regulator with XRE-family HTH domain
MADIIFAKQLRKIRTSKRKTQLELAGQLHVSDKVISSYERGVREPDIQTLRRIAIALEVSLDTLLDIEAVSKLLCRMPPDVAKNVRNLLENVNESPQVSPSSEAAQTAN